VANTSKVLHKDGEKEKRKQKEMKETQEKTPKSHST
jgi:hypothetical protein